MRREILFELRNKNGLTHEDVAKAIGISRSHYGLIENGNRNPSYEVAQRLAKFFKTSIKELFPDVIFFAGRCYVEKHSKEAEKTKTA